MSWRVRFPILVLALLSVCCAHRPVTFEDFRASAPRVGQGYRYGDTVDVGDVDAEPMAAAFLKFKGLADSGSHRITFRIDSPGGSIRLGLRWIRLVTDVKKAHGIHVDCIVDGAAYSMAAIILESPVCDGRFATPSSTILFHNGHGGGEGTAEEIEQAGRMLEAFNTAIASLVADRMGMPVAEYRRRIAGRDWVMATPEALVAHVIDSVVSSAEIAPPVEE